MIAARLRSDRGFSLILVLLVLLLLAIVGTGSLVVAGSDHGAASARNMRALALLAAESGVAHYLQQAQPGLAPDQTTGGGASGSGDPLASQTPIAGPTTLPDGGGDHELQYVVWGGPPIGSGATYIVEGRVVEPGSSRVIARARVSVGLRVEGGDDEYGNVGGGSSGSGVVGSGADTGFQGL